MLDKVYRRIEAHAANPIFIHVLPKARVEERLRGRALARIARQRFENSAHSPHIGE